MRCELSQADSLSGNPRVKVSEGGQSDILLCGGNWKEWQHANKRGPRTSMPPVPPLPKTHLKVI